MFAKRIFASAVLSLACESAIAQQGGAPPQEAWWSSAYGETDTLGALNNLSPDIVRKAAKLIRTGKVYQLGVKTGPSTPAYGPRIYSVERISSTGDVAIHDGSGRPTAFDEKVTLSMGIGTQIDGLAHLGVDNRYYNGTPGIELAKGFGLDLASIPPIVTRGVLIDMAKYMGKPMLQPGDVYNRAEIEAAAKAQNVKIRKGDVVLFHTGWIEAATTDREAYRSREPGIGEGGAIYLADLGVAAIGSDTIALEAIPFENEARPFIVHQTLLAKKGVHILESIDTRDLAKDGAREFLFIAAPPRFEGTVQVVVNPIAIR